MKQLLAAASILLAAATLPTNAHAHPNHPNAWAQRCTDDRGHVRCDIPGCGHLCDSHGHPRHSEYHSPQHNPPHVSRPEPLPPPPPHVTRVPSPMTPMQIEDRIRKLSEQHASLARQLKFEREEAEKNYRHCMSIPPHVRGRCIPPHEQVRELEIQAEEIRLEIERLKEMQRHRM